MFVKWVYSQNPLEHSPIFQSYLQKFEESMMNESLSELCLHLPTAIENKETFEIEELRKKAEKLSEEMKITRDEVQIELEAIVCIVWKKFSKTASFNKNKVYSELPLEQVVSIQWTQMMLLKDSWKKSTKSRISSKLQQSPWWN